MSEAELAKLKKRQARNMAKAGAEGFLMGLASQLTPEDTVVDCGANVGDVAEPLAETGAALHAFEPDPFAFGKLAKENNTMIIPSNLADASSLVATAMSVVRQTKPQAPQS